MENATKALLIAGGVLVVIVLIALGIQMVNTTRPTTEKVESTISAKEIQTYNSRFIQYAGTQKGSVLKSIVSAVRQNNITNPDNIIQVMIGIDTEKYSNGACIEPNSATTNYYTRFFAGEEILGIKYDISGDYIVAVMRNGEKAEKTGYINYIYISPKEE